MDGRRNFQYIQKKYLNRSWTSNIYDMNVATTNIDWTTETKQLANIPNHLVTKTEQSVKLTNTCKSSLKYYMAHLHE